MIARLKGEVAELAEDRLCLDVQGVGYDVMVPGRLAQTARVGEALTLHVHTSVREDAISLYGFASAQEKVAFEKLVSINGIGPKLGLAALSAMTVEQLGNAIAGNDLRALSGVPGIGKKTAERIVLELRGKFAFVPAGAGAAAAAVLPQAPTRSPEEDAFVLALAQLGYKRTEIDTVRAQLSERGQDKGAVGERIRAALALLGGAR
jgi:Holliday junction DNA helicase RuvA